MQKKKKRKATAEATIFGRKTIGTLEECANEKLQKKKKKSNTRRM